MKNLIIAASILLLVSCVLVGSGIKTITGTVTAADLTDIKIGIFAPEDRVVFFHDNLNDADKDVVFKNGNGAESSAEAGVGSFSPVLMVTPGSGGTYTMELPDDPSTVKCMIAWDDADGDDQFDLGTEAAYLPVKTINGTAYVIHHFSYIEVTQVITYLAVYSTMDRAAVDYDLDFYDPRQDNFDAIGAGGYDFNFD